MKILVLNCGSSSIKYQLLDMHDESVLSSGLADKVGIQGSCIKHETQDGRKIVFNGDIIDHKAGIEYILGIITSKAYGAIRSFDEINAVGHRVVHGGEEFKQSRLVTDEILSKIIGLSNIAPLHNPPNAKGIEAISSIIPNVPQVAVFDTAFHQTMPRHAYMYGIPYTLYKKYAIRRYGFHGTSHLYVSNRAAKILGKDINNSKIITCHLGNGASLAAIENGKSVDTSMGFTPTEGLIMGTRCGDLDIGVIPFLIENENVTSYSISTLINKHSGMLGISGKSSDMRDVENGYLSGDERYTLAVEMYVYKIKKYIGSYIAAMNGVDTIVFTGGLGENGGVFRELICKNLDCFGIEIDKSINDSLRGKEQLISTQNSKIQVIVVPTNEELVIARDTLAIIK